MMQGFFITRKLISVIRNINKLKNKKHTIILNRFDRQSA